MRKGVQFSTAWPARQQSALNNRPISNEDVLILDLAIFGQIPPREYCHRRSSACLAVSSAGLDNRPPNHMWRRGHRDVTHTKRRKCIKYRIDHGWRRPDRTSLPAALDAEGLGCARSEEHTSELQSLMRLSD